MVLYIFVDAFQDLIWSRTFLLKSFGTSFGPNNTFESFQYLIWSWKIILRHLSTSYGPVHFFRCFSGPDFEAFRDLLFSQ